jgi:hypothetical protein
MINRDLKINPMKYLILLFFIVVVNVSHAQQKAETKYYNEKYFLVEGTTFMDSVKENLYDRLPVSYKNKVRKPVWELSKNSAGISVRFLTNSSSIKVKWELLENYRMNHMAETGIKGIDLYCKVGDHWQFVNTARPEGKNNYFLLVEHMQAKKREFKMYLPLYDGTTKLEIGIDSISTIEKPLRSNKKPVIFYGTSITQGGCASRPGMAYTNIISRRLNVDCLNFGFSGNGKMEKPLVELLSGISASCYVIDGTGNMTPAEVHENAIPLIETIRSKQASTPVIFVEGPISERAFWDDSTKVNGEDKNKALKIEYEKMIKRGFKNIYYISSQGLKGNDHESTVDAVHFTDLGFLRYSDFLISKFDQFKLTKTIRQ